MTAGIVCDNYKVIKFIEAFAAANFEYTVSTGVNRNTKIFMVEYSNQREFHRIAEVCKNLETGFLNSRTNDNL